MADMEDRVNRMTTIGTAWLSLVTALGAVAVSSCCVLPLALSLAGLSGAWLGDLPGLISYRSYFLAAAALALVVAWAVAVQRRTDCAPDDACARPSRSWTSFGVLGLSTLVVGVAAGWPWIEPTLISVLLRLTEAAA